jgi:DnaJ domain
MSEPIQAFPLQWPPGWRRIASYQRKRARFANYKRELSVMDGIGRVLEELSKLEVKRDDLVISTNVPTRLDGLPRSDKVPADPGAAVYWTKGKETRCMAIDRYDRVQDNLAAIAATLEAMRAIERHGGAEILDRAFTGFVALPAPEQWFNVLGVSIQATHEQIEEAYRKLAMKHHPDRPGGNAGEMARINAARDEGLQIGSA